MSMSSVIIVSLAAAVILVIGGGLVMYMSSLVKNAYELKVQISADIDARLGKMAEDLDKKSRWIKRDLIEEIEKIKVALETENGRKFEALALPLNNSLEGINAQVRRDRAEWSAAIERDRLLIAQLESQIDALRGDLKSPSSPSGSAPAQEPIPLGDPSAAVSTVAPAAPAQSDPRTMSQFLPDLGRKR
ncbi:hypothetical protein SAMN04244559_01977 [Magnetospirillum fulvum]|uniref:Uncharacterized protein n=2 Tax=Magnetospirillum fulvum TaxID=1082 RepID=A0A1H6HU10_MAGFU|nr:hypothetical protein SAMN04244559_01977 [Magnetospirillum fulvum]